MSQQFSPEAPRKQSLLNAQDRLILALDFPAAAHANFFLEDLRRRSQQPPLWLKVGLELFLAEGPSFVQQLRSQGYSIFLDLKLHDIPNTVASAIRALAALEVGLLTVHASGGPAMLAAAVDAAASLACPPRLLAVTVLTSMDQEQLVAAGIERGPAEQVLLLAATAWQAGVRGLVTSPLEAAMLRSTFGEALHLVTPGIRAAWQQGSDDQQRTAVATKALRAGASQLVIGRPITRAADPVEAYQMILQEIQAEINRVQV